MDFSIMMQLLQKLIRKITETVGSIYSVVSWICCETCDRVYTKLSFSEARVSHLVATIIWLPLS